MSTPHKIKTKAQKKKEKERQQRLDMAAELHLIHQLSKTVIQPDGKSRPAANQSGGSSGGSADATPPETREAAAATASAATITTSTSAANLPPESRKPPVLSNPWPPAPKLPIGQAPSYGWKIQFPSSNDSLRPMSLIGIKSANNNNGENAGTQLPLNSGMIDHYKYARRQRYVKAALQSGLTWDCNK